MIPTPVAPGPECAAGGQRVNVGFDANGDLELTGTEVQGTFLVCNGTDGQSGQNGATGLVQTVELAPGEENCPAGGLRVEYGLDDGSGNGTAHDGVLDDDEVTATEVICHGTSAVASGGGGCSLSQRPTSSSALWMLFGGLGGIGFVRRRQSARERLPSMARTL